jgi:DNA-binding transcriptional ArsR family regulator
VAIAYAEADDAFIITMTCILGLCWAYDYQRTSTLTPEQLAESTDRPRSTLYRHLKLLREMHWIRLDRVGRPIVIYPIMTHCAQAVDREAPRTEQRAAEPVLNEALLQALTDIGVENPKRSQLAGLDIDPLWVQAWQLWAKHPYRRSLTNPVGNIILKLESGEGPLHEFLRAAEEEIQLRQWTQEQEQADMDENLEEKDELDPEEDGLSEARQIWTGALEELKLQMTRSQIARLTPVRIYAILWAYRTTCDIYSEIVLV